MEISLTTVPEAREYSLNYYAIKQSQL